MKQLSAKSSVKVAGTGKEGNCAGKYSCHSVLISEHDLSVTKIGC